MRTSIIVALGLAALVVLFLVVRPGPEPEPAASPRPSPTGSAPASPTTTPTANPGADALEIEAEAEEGRVELEVENQRRPGGSRVRVDIGTRLSVEVNSDTADEIHVHGYDLRAGVGPERRGRIRFHADVPGIFEVELEGSGLLLFRLEVTP